MGQHVTTSLQKNQDNQDKVDSGKAKSLSISVSSRAVKKLIVGEYNSMSPEVSFMRRL